MPITPKPRTPRKRKPYRRPRCGPTLGLHFCDKRRGHKGSHHCQCDIPKGKRRVYA